MVPTGKYTYLLVTVFLAKIAAQDLVHLPDAQVEEVTDEISSETPGERLR